MRRRSIPSRIAYILSLALFLEALLPSETYAEQLNISAGEALVLEGRTVAFDSLKDMAEETPSGNAVIRIDSPFDLLNMAKYSTIDSYSEGKTFRLTSDIDMSAYGFTTIPVFSGVFDGGGYTISGLTYGGDGYVTGLFRYVNQGAVIENLTVTGKIEANDEEEITGGICGINQGIISNCTFDGRITGKTVTGGIAAINEVSGTIMACENKGLITGYYYTGGIAGKNYGVIAYTENKGSVNNTSEWVEGSDAMDTGSDIVSAILSGRVADDAEDTNIRALNGIDTGGISGFSRGAVYQCKNTGDIGYAHTGYNTGGIAGRQAGFISFCSNTGTIYGRKDIGGIVGQMEPYLTLSDLETLPEAVDKLHDLVDVSIDDMDDTVGILSDDINLLSAYADNAVTAGDELGTSAETYLNSVSGAADSLVSRVDYLAEHMPKVFDYLSEANDELNQAADDAKKLVGDADVYKRITASSNKVVSINEAMEDLRDETNTFNEKKNAVDRILENVVPDAVDAAKTISGNTERLHDSLSDATHDIKKGTDHAGEIIDHLNSMERVNVPYLGSDFDAARESLADNLSGMSHSLSQLADHSDASSEKISSDLSEVNDQINVVFHLISDQLDRIGNITRGDSDDIITDVSEEDIDMITEGRVDHSANKGIVEGDINIGGIAGSMSIDSDDPEENAAGGMDGGFNAKYLLRNMIIDCSNDAFIESKKDGAGGIAGFMEQGIIKDCESYGSVTSTEGGYVGGITGQSHSIIKDSYAMNYLDGDSNIGGIAGYGTTIRGCSSLPSFESVGDRCGSIAGKIEADKDTHIQHFEAVSGNSFVNDEVAGIDNISILDKAYPVSYSELIKDPGLPSAFRRMRLIFKVDDDIVGTSDMPYGSALKEVTYPAVSVSSDQYVKWDAVADDATITATTVLHGELTDLLKTLESDARYPDTNMPMALISGLFYGTDSLAASVTAGDMEISYEVSYTGENQDRIAALRLYAPFGKYELYGISDDGNERVKLDSEKKGSYAEIKGAMQYRKYELVNTGIVDRIKNRLSELFR